MIKGSLVSSWKRLALFHEIIKIKNWVGILDWKSEKSQRGIVNSLNAIKSTDKVLLLALRMHKRNLCTYNTSVLQQSVPAWQVKLWVFSVTGLKDSLFKQNTWYYAQNAIQTTFIILRFVLELNGIWEISWGALRLNFYWSAIFV